MGLFELVKHEKSMRRLFGQQELKIIEKQLLGINLSASEKTRLSRDIRPKFEIVKEIARFSDEFKLKKAAGVKKKIERALELILEDKLRNKIKEIWLFGSSVENKRTFKSDIDIAVLFDQIDLREATKFRIRILGNFDEKMDIQVYNVLPEKIKKEIDKKGRILYERKN